MLRPTRLIDIISAKQLSPLQLERLARIDAEDFAPVRAKVKADMLKLGVEVIDDWLDRGILALKQYYAVAVLDPLNRHAVSDAIDPFWHAHILHTKQYMSFCDDVTDGYIHHEPLDHANRAAMDEIRALYDYTAQCYKQLFMFIDAEFFPEVLDDERLVCKHMEVRSPALRAVAVLPMNLALPQVSIAA